MESLELVGAKLPRGAPGMDPRPPERLVGVDVPDAGEAALVEDCRLDGRTATGERLRKAFRGEAPFEWLASDTGGQVGVELLRLDEKPRAEAADVSVRDVRSVV